MARKHTDTPTAPKSDPEIEVSIADTDPPQEEPVKSEPPPAPPPPPPVEEKVAAPKGTFLVMVGSKAVGAPHENAMLAIRAAELLVKEGKCAQHELQILPV